MGARSVPTGPWPSRESHVMWPNITPPRRSTRAPTRAVRFACPLPGAWRDTWPRAASSWTPSSRGQSKRRTFPGVLTKTVFGDESKSGMMEPQNRSSETSFNIFESHWREVLGNMQRFLASIAFCFVLIWTHQHQNKSFQWDTAAKLDITNS